MLLRNQISSHAHAVRFKIDHLALSTCMSLPEHNKKRAHPKIVWTKALFLTPFRYTAVAKKTGSQRIEFIARSIFSQWVTQQIVKREQVSLGRFNE